MTQGLGANKMHYTLTEDRDNALAVGFLLTSQQTKFVAYFLWFLIYSQIPCL